MKTNPRRTIFSSDPRLAFAAAAADAPDSIGTLTGYALVWNVLSSDRGGYKVRLLPGSATFATPTHALYQHALTGGPLGDTVTKTLRIFPDDIGVRVEIDVPNTTLGRDVAELVRTRRIAGMSFHMATEAKARRVVENGQEVIEAEQYAVDEVTVTAVPAFTETTIELQADPAYCARRNKLDQLRLTQYRLAPGVALPRFTV